MIGAIAIGLAVWIIVSALSLPGMAWAIGRLKRMIRSRRDDSCCYLTLSQPEVPQNERPVEDWSVDEILADEQAVYDALVEQIDIERRTWAA